MGELHHVAFKATVRVQKFSDESLRVQIQKPQLNIDGWPFDFYSSLARQIKMPFLVHLKMGRMQSFYVAKDEWYLIVDLKRLVLSQLGIGRQSEDAHGLKKEDTIYGECTIGVSSSQLDSATSKVLEMAWIQAELNEGIPPSVGGRDACSDRNAGTYAEYETRMDLNKCKCGHALVGDLAAEYGKCISGLIQSPMVSY